MVLRWQKDVFNLDVAKSCPDKLENIFLDAYSHAYILKAHFFCNASLIERETNSINDFMKITMNQFQEKQLVFSRQKRKVNTTHEIKRDEEKSWSVALLSSKLSEV